MLKMLDGRTNTAATRRAEQLKRWNESDTNRESAERTSRRKPSKIKFSDGCVFLAACAAGDKDEVKKRLEDGNTDIDTANIDGLTALHQACIDDNLEMVEFLVEHGSDLNRGDNEGWTPLHATASCGFISIAKYLIDSGADVAAVNNDGDLPIDIAESDEMEEILQTEINKQKIDCEKARNAEEKMMMTDAEKFLKDSSVTLVVHEKTGATPLHVAAAKGYIKVMSILIKAGINMDVQDFDGWTALHAAAHWCQREACELLIESLCDIEIKNFAGQTAFDVADPDIVTVLEEMKKKQATLKKNTKEIEQLIKKTDPPPLKRRTSVTRMSVADKSHVVMKDASSERAALLKHPENLDESQTRTRIEETIEEDETNAEESNHIDEKGDLNSIDQNDILEEMVKKSQEQDKKETEIKKINQEKVEPCKSSENNDVIENKEVDNIVPIWRRVRNRSNVNTNDKADQVSLASDLNTSQPTVNTRVSLLDSNNSSNIRTNRNCASWNLPTITNTSLLRSASFPTSRYRNRLFQNDSQVAAESSVGPNTTVTTSLSSSALATASTSPTMVTMSLPCTSNVRRSTVPPVRDEESETQRRAHAKRVRETRRSTQGVTLEDLKSAEQQYLRKQQEEDEKKEQENEKQEKEIEPEPGGADSEKRISWRQRYQQLQDDDAKEPVYRRSRNQNSMSSDDVSAVSTSALTTATVTSTTASAARQSDSLPRHSYSDSRSENETKDTDELDKNSQGTQAVIIRRRRPKRRSTGVVMLDLDDAGNVSNSVTTKSEDLKPSEERSRSRFSESSQSLASNESNQSAISTENGETAIDYKQLYEEMKEENERLKSKLVKTENALKETRDQLDKVLQNNRNSMSDTEKRERRALERKLSEMEEEIKLMDQLKTENSKYRDENGALIRVISKLSK